MATTSQSKASRAQASSATALTTSSLRQAFAAGDFRRAQALAAALRAPGVAVLPAETNAEIDQLSRAWRLDPYVVQVGMGTLALYAAAWAYALAQYG